MVRVRRPTSRTWLGPSVMMRLMLASHREAAGGLGDVGAGVAELRGGGTGALLE